MPLQTSLAVTHLTNAAADQLAWLLSISLGCQASHKSAWLLSISVNDWKCLPSTAVSFTLWVILTSKRSAKLVCQVLSQVLSLCLCVCLSSVCVLKFVHHSVFDASPAQRCHSHFGSFIEECMQVSFDLTAMQPSWACHSCVSHSQDVRECNGAG